MCGVVVYGRTRHKQFCEECKTARKLESCRAAADAQRRKAGIPKVKGETFACERCGADFVATSKSRAMYCEPCRPAVQLDRARALAYAKGSDTGRKRIGRVEFCAHCFNEFRVEKRGPASFCLECRKLWDRGRLPHQKEAYRKYRKHRTQTDPQFAINDIMRGGILKSLGPAKAGRSWQKLVGYTVEQLRDHLERQFTSGMTWENRGLNGWHIDHIQPLSSFSYTSAEDSEFGAAWCLTNLRPMWGDENIRKKDKRLYLI